MFNKAYVYDKFFLIVNEAHVLGIQVRAYAVIKNMPDVKYS